MVESLEKKVKSCLRAGNITLCSSRCLLWWTCQLNFNEKDFSHWSQANAFSPVCVNWWTLSECLVVKYLGHLSQGNFSVSSSITLLSYIGSFTTWQRTMWSFKDGKILKDLSHWLQGNGLSSEWIFLCKIRFVDVVKDFPQSSQGCGFSPEWLLLWSLMYFLSLNRKWTFLLAELFLCDIWSSTLIGGWLRRRHSQAARGRTWRRLRPSRTSTPTSTDCRQSDSGLNHTSRLIITWGGAGGKWWGTSKSGRTNSATSSSLATSGNSWATLTKINNITLIIMLSLNNKRNYNTYEVPETPSQFIPSQFLVKGDVRVGGLLHRCNS